MTENMSLTQERVNSNIFGVALFIVDPQNRVLTFREKETKPSTGKVAGDYSVLCETRKAGEGWLANIRRGLTEELGLREVPLKDIFDFSDRRIWESGFISKVWSTVAVLRCNNPSKLEELIGSGGDTNGVEVIGWKTREEFESLPLRMGVRNLMNKFGDNIFQ